ncbi:MAG: lipopolysaccharide heptosyltransferase I [Bauldia sp.]
MRVLLVKLSSFGDVIHALPALTDAKAALPDLEIDWLVDAAFAGVASVHPAVGTVYPLALRELRWPPPRWAGLASSLAALRRELRARRYDLVIDAQGLMKSAAAARLAGAPVAGLGSASAREGMASRLYQRTFEVERDLHAVERVRRLFSGALGYPLPAGEGSFGLRRGDFKPPERVWLPARYGLLVPSASWPSKHWPEERWQALLAGIAETGDKTVILWGSAAERERAERLAAGRAGAIVPAERLEGRPLLGLLAAAAWTAGLDSGLMHLAAALGVPGLWLYGPTDPGLTGPYGSGQRVVRSTHPAAPCLTRRCTLSPDGLCCMRGIEARAAVLAWREARGGGGR